MTAGTADTAIKGGVLVSGKGMNRADLFIKDGLVDGIEPAGGTRLAKKVIDASGRLVLPGIIDVHLHPVYADRIGGVSVSGAHGGVTTLIPYIGAVKSWGGGDGALDVMKNFIEEGERDSVVDFALHCVLIHDDVETADTLIPEAIKLGVTSFKGFMAYSRRGMKLEDGELMRIMEIIAANGGLFATHAENGAMIDFLVDRFIAQGKTTPEYYLQGHPKIAETEAVFRILGLAKALKCPIYLPHLSAWESLDVVRMFREWGESEVYAETCVHYLTLTDDELKKRGGLAKVGPPLRQQKDVEEMWRAVDEGVIDVIATDAVGYMMKDRGPIWDNIFEVPFGLPGIESLLTVTYDEGVNKGRTTLPKLVKSMTETPARIFGLYPKKGVLEPGSDADVVIFDPTVPHVITAENQHLNADYTMHEGRQCLGAPTVVMQRGEILIEGGELKANPGRGSFLARTVS
jgi:dihydropyrimidinase